MFNERFDKILKQNLESVKPEYQPQAWDRFSKRLPAAGFWPFIQLYGGWLLCGMMMAGWLTTLYTLRENQDIIRQISSDQNRNVMIKGGTKESLPDSDLKASSMGKKPDTVYIVKKTIVEHKYYTKEQDLGRQAAIADNNNTTSNRAITNPELGFDHSVLVSDKFDSKIEQGNISSTSYSDNKPIAREPKELFKQNPVASLIDSSGIQNSLISAKTDSVGKELNIETVIAMIDSAWSKQSAKQKLKVAYTDSLSERHPYALEQQIHSEPKRASFRLSSLHPRFGIESITSRYSQGFGPTVEVFPLENLGVSFGLHASTLRAENHKALRDYNSATGKLFLVQYRSYLPLNFDRISDISIQTSVVSIPVNLKYYIPLKNAISLFVQSGTSLDLSAYQQVNFESYLKQSKRRNTFETDAKPAFFHDFMFGAGVQYRRSRILAQVAPYYVYDFRGIVNTAAGSNLGLKASLWVNLYK